MPAIFASSSGVTQAASSPVEFTLRSLTNKRQHSKIVIGMTRQRILFLAAAYASWHCNRSSRPDVHHRGAVRQLATPVVDARGATASGRHVRRVGSSSHRGERPVARGALALPLRPRPCLDSRRRLAFLQLLGLHGGGTNLLVAEAAAAAARRTGEADVGFLATVRELLGDDVSRVTGATYAFLHYALLVAIRGAGWWPLAGALFWRPPRPSPASGLRRWRWRRRGVWAAQTRRQGQ